jgi:L-aspartate oxidase
MDADVLVIGAGLAGLACALACDDAGSVLIVNDTQPASDVASAWAQGGLAAALGTDDAPALHVADTIAAAGGIADDAIVRDLAAEAPAAIALLERFGVPFDRAADGSLALGLEAAHSRRRIVHAADHTGASIVRRLLDAVAARTNIRLITGLRAIDLVGIADGAIAGADFVDAVGGCRRIMAGAVVLASGGYGGLFAKTTTPGATLGAGIALAARRRWRRAFRRRTRDARCRRARDLRRRRTRRARGARRPPDRRAVRPAIPDDRGALRRGRDRSRSRAHPGDAGGALHDRRYPYRCRRPD